MSLRQPETNQALMPISTCMKALNFKVEKLGEEYECSISQDGGKTFHVFVFTGSKTWEYGVCPAEAEGFESKIVPEAFVRSFLNNLTL